MDILTENNMYGMSFILADQHAQQHTMDSAMKNKLITAVLVFGVVVAYSAMPPPAEVERILEGKSSRTISLTKRSLWMSHLDIVTRLKSMGISSVSKVVPPTNSFRR